MTGVDPLEERIQQNRIARNNRIYERQQIARRQRSPQEYVGYDAATGLHRLRGAEGDRLVPSITTGGLESGAIVRSGPGSVDGLQAAQPLVFERERRRSAPLSTRFYTISSNSFNAGIVAVFQVDVRVPQKTAEIRVSYRWAPLDPTPEDEASGAPSSGVRTNGLQLGNAQICGISVRRDKPRYLGAANPMLGTWVAIDSMPYDERSLFWSYTLNSQGNRAYCGYTVKTGDLAWQTRIIEFSPTDYTIFRRIDAGFGDRSGVDPPYTIAEVGGLLYVNGDIVGLLFIDLETEAKTVIFNTKDLPGTAWFIDGYETVFVQQVFKKDEQTIGVFLFSVKGGEAYFGIATASISAPTNFSYESIYSANVGAEIGLENPKIFYSKKTKAYYFLGSPNVPPPTPSTGLEGYNYLGYWRAGDVPQFLKLRYAPGQSDEDKALILDQWTNGLGRIIFLNIDGRFEV